MNLGKLIRSYRIYRNMTMQELADDLCDKSYIYRIEKDLRVPSFHMMLKISSKLNFSLLDALSFNDYDNPVYASELVEKLAKFRHNNQFEDIINIYEQLNNTEFMLKYPTKQYLQLSWCYAIIFSHPGADYKKLESILTLELNSLGYSLSKPETLHTLTPVDCHLLITYALLQKKLGNIDLCINLLESVLLDIDNKKSRYIYTDVFIIAMIDYISSGIKKASMISDKEKSMTLIKSLKSKSFELEKFQIDINSYNRLPLTYIYLYYFLSNENDPKAEEYKKRALLLSEIQNNMGYIEVLELVVKILEDGLAELPFPYIS